MIFLFVDNKGIKLTGSIFDEDINDPSLFKPSGSTQSGINEFLKSNSIDRTKGKNLTFFIKAYNKMKLKCEVGN